MAHRSPATEFEDCSNRFLQDIRLQRQSSAANHRKEIFALFDVLVQETAEALLALWLYEFRMAQPGARPAEQVAFEFAVQPQLGPKKENPENEHRRPRKRSA